MTRDSDVSEFILGEHLVKTKVNMEKLFLASSKSRGVCAICVDC